MNPLLLRRSCGAGAAYFAESVTPRHLARALRALFRGVSVSHLFTKQSGHTLNVGEAPNRPNEFHLA
jgi:hypothetical protein